MADTRPNAYQYRIAFGAWINDMRRDPLPLQNWPAPQLDDEAIDSAIRAMDVQAAAGFTLLDVWGLFATYGYPPDIVSVLDNDRRKRVHRLLKAGRERGIGMVLGLGTYSWGYDRILEADPEVRGKDAAGNPHPHALCDANPRSFGYVRKILDCLLSEFDFAGVHLESCDLGCCMCPECAGKDGVVGYNVRLNTKTAGYIRSKWPDKVLYVITINWVPPGKHFTAEEKAHVIALSRHIDCLFDQGHRGYHVAEAERRQFIQQLHCAYGTSGGLWLYPSTRWDRASYFLPYVQRAGAAIKSQYTEGVRGCLFYQGPVNNPGTEVNIAVGGRLLADTTRDVHDVLSQVLEETYRPRNAEALRRLTAFFLRAEDAYCGQWRNERFARLHGTPPPGEFKLDELWGTSPGPASYLSNLYLDEEGRYAYKQELKAMLSEVDALRGSFRDGGRLERIRSALIHTLTLINTIASCQGERKVFVDW